VDAIIADEWESKGFTAKQNQRVVAGVLFPLRAYGDSWFLIDKLKLCHITYATLPDTCDGLFCY